MEPRGENPLKSIIVIVPGRYASERLPGKMLLDIAGKPLIVHTLERSMRAKSVSRVIAAVDDPRLVKGISAYGYEVILTSQKHRSGSDRIAEVAKTLPADALVVNVQGDEPLIEPQTIDLVAGSLANDTRADMATVSVPITSVEHELLNPNVVKLVCDDEGYARYFSRSPIPFSRDAVMPFDGDLRAAVRAHPELLRTFRKHVGIYAYRRDYLLRFTSLPQSQLERIESLEQLRALNDNAKIRVVATAGSSTGVDTAADYLRTKEIIETGISLRVARDGDWESIARVHVACWQSSFREIVPRPYLDSLSVEDRRSMLGRRKESIGYEMLVAESQDDGIVGFLDFGPSTLMPGRGMEVYSFYVLASHQRRGIGNRLFRASISSMAERGISKLHLQSLEASPYRAFYKKKGGEVFGHSQFESSGRSMPTVIYVWDDITAI